ncbi:MAG: hypothetical protein ACYDHH_07505 [Solirubrobacteraceae bacterium]
MTLDDWLPNATLRLRHERAANASADDLWRAAMAVTIAQTGTLGRLIRWRIPGTTGALSFRELFTQPPFVVLHEHEHLLISGLVGRIWTLRRDYPRLSDADQFRAHAERGTARVAFAHRVCATGDRVGPKSVLVSEARVEPIGVQGRIGVAAVAPLVRSFGGLVGSDGLAAAVRRAEGAEATS